MTKPALSETRRTSFECPEPRLTAEEMVARSAGLISLVAENSAEAERLGRYPEVVHEAFLKAGFYRVIQPRMFGGYEFDLETFYKITINIARGCPATAWCFSFSVGHTMEVASFFCEQAQAEIYGPTGDFRAPFYGGIPGVGTRVAGGWHVKGKFPFCSGSPYSTHMVGHFSVSDDEAERTGSPARMFVVPRDQYTILDDWVGKQFGMSGTGSNSIAVDTVIPEHHTIGETMLDLKVDGGTVGTRLHGNPMYGMPVIGYMTAYFAAVAIGAAYAGLDAYEQDIRSRKLPINPSARKMQSKKDGSEAVDKDDTIPFRYEDEGYQRCYGRALSEIQAAEALVLTVARKAKEFAQKNLEEGQYPPGFDSEQTAMAQIAATMARNSFDYNLWRMVGAPATRPGTRMNRLFRDLGVIGNHNALGFAESTPVTLGKAKLGVA